MKISSQFPEWNNLQIHPQCEEKIHVTFYFNFTEDVDMKTWNEMKGMMFDEDPLLIFARAGEMEGITRSVNVMNLEKRDRKGYTPLMLSAMKGHLEAVNYFLMLNADIHARDTHGNSVLMAAAFHGHYSVVKLLLEHGADPEATNLKKQTAILFARTFGHEAIEKILIERMDRSHYS